MKYQLIRTAKYIFFFLPEGIKNRIIEKRQKKNLIEARMRAKRTIVSKDEVASIVNSLDIDNCDIILHS